MTKRIAIAGKGGTGKTTFCGLLIKELLKRKEVPVLAIDADPNANLNEMLGMNYEATIADIREEIKSAKNIPQGMSKPDYINYKLSQNITEGEGIDLLVMGRPEGRGCYCYVNELLRNFLSAIGKNYKFIVIDNEAGMEHLSRRTTDNVDILYILMNPDTISVNSAKKIFELAKELELKIEKIYFVASIVFEKNDFLRKTEEDFRKNGLEIAGFIPYNEEMKKGVIQPDKAINIVSEISKIIDKTIY